MSSCQPVKAVCHIFIRLDKLSPVSMVEKIIVHVWKPRLYTRTLIYLCAARGFFVASRGVVRQGCLSRRFP